MKLSGSHSNSYNGQFSQIKQHRTTCICVCACFNCWAVRLTFSKDQEQQKVFLSPVLHNSQPPNGLSSIFLPPICPCLSLTSLYHTLTHPHHAQLGPVGGETGKCGGQVVGMVVGGVYGGVVFTLLGMAMFPGIQGLFYDYPCHGVCWVPYLLSCISSQPRYFSFRRILCLSCLTSWKKGTGALTLWRGSRSCPGQDYSSCSHLRDP